MEEDAAHALILRASRWTRWVPKTVIHLPLRQGNGSKIKLKSWPSWRISMQHKVQRTLLATKVTYPTSNGHTPTIKIFHRILPRMSRVNQTTISKARMMENAHQLSSSVEDMIGMDASAARMVVRATVKANGTNSANRQRVNTRA